MVHEVLVERVVLGHQDRERVGVATARTAGLLPHRCARAGIAGEHGGVERADVDPELERVRGRDRQQFAVRQLALDRPAVLRQIAGSVRLDACALLRVAHVPPCELRQQLGGAPGPGEADRADVLLDELRHQPRRLGERAPSCAGVLVDDRRVPEREQLLARRCGVGHDLVERQPRQARRELTGVADRGARQHPARVAAVVGDQPPEPAERHRHVRPEHAAAHVRLVDHHQRQAEEEVRPPGVVREQGEVQHVGVRHHQVRVLTDQRALGARRVPVVDRRLHLRDRQRADGAELVPGEGLGREEVERGGASGVRRPRPRTPGCRPRSSRWPCPSPSPGSCRRPGPRDLRPDADRDRGPPREPSGPGPVAGSSPGTARRRGSERGARARGRATPRWFRRPSARRGTREGPSARCYRRDLHPRSCQDAATVDERGGSPCRSCSRSSRR